MSTITRLTFSLAAVALTVGATSDAFACGGGGGGYRGRVSNGYGGGYGGGYHAPRYTPTYRQPAYRQPVYQQPVYQPRIVQQPVIQQPAVQQPFVQQRLIQQPVAAPQAPQAPQQPAAPSAGTPQQTALDALMSLSGGQAAPAAPQAGGFVGAWRATVGSSQVELTLNADGSFRWNANASGKVSSFDGRFTLAGGQLTLVRGDSQQLAGSWSADATGGFRFKLAGANDSGLLFVRG